jgi:hypothetical protein
MKKISWIVLVCFFIAACKKERIEPEQYPFVFGATNWGSYTCTYGCGTKNPLSSLTHYLEIDKKFNIYIKNQSGVTIFKGKFKKIKLKSTGREFEYISEYDIPIPDYVNYYSYKFDIEISSIYINNYADLMKDIKEIDFNLYPLTSTKNVNGNYISYYKSYIMFITFESRYNWGDRKSNNIFSYSFVKKEI